MYYQVTAGIFSAVTFLIEFQMDLYKAIQELYAEKEKLERVIASLEELQRSAGTAPILPKATGRRGRKSMNSKERLEVSERMKKYWESRRKTGTDDRESSEGQES